MSIADKARDAVAVADSAVVNATASARAAQSKRDGAAGGYTSSHPAWEWVEYAEQSARRAKEYARQAAAAASAHDIPEANRRLRNAWSEAWGATSNAERAAKIASIRD